MRMLARIASGENLGSDGRLSFLGVKPRVFVYAPSEEAAVDRAVRHEPYAELFARAEHPVFFDLAPHEVVFALDGGERLDGVSPAYGVSADLANSPALYLARPYQIPHRARDILNGNFRVEAVLVKQLYAVEPKAFQGLFAISLYRFGAAVLPSRTLAVDDLVPEFRCERDLPLERLEGFPRQFLVVQGAVNYGGVK